MRRAIVGALWALAGVMAADAMAFAIWILSGQTPVDGFYLGALTANIIKLFI